MTTQQSERIVVYVRPALRQRVTEAIEESGQSPQDWLRAALAAALEPPPDGTLALKLESAQMEIRRLEEHLQDAREQRDVANASNTRMETLVAQSQPRSITSPAPCPPGAGRRGGNSGPEPRWYNALRKRKKPPGWTNHLGGPWYGIKGSHFMPQEHYNPGRAESGGETPVAQASLRSLRMLTRAVWNANHDDERCPDNKYPTFRQLEELITTTAWGSEAREQFFQRWVIVEKTTAKRFEAGSFAELAHLVWEAAVAQQPDLKRPLAPLIAAWQSGPAEVLAVRDAAGNLRPDTIMPRVAMRDRSSSRTDRLYLLPAHIGTDGEGTQVTLPGLEGALPTGRIPVLQRIEGLPQTLELPSSPS